MKSAISQMRIVWLGLAYVGMVWCGGVQAAELSGQPKLFSPMDGMEITDVASYFTWSPVGHCTNYDFQIARDPGFAMLVKEKHLVSRGYHKHCYRPKDLLLPGTYYWRVRAVSAGRAGDWSQPFSVKVNDAHPVLPEPVRSISPEHPLFLMRSRAWDPVKNSAHVREILPDGLERVIVVDDLALASDRVLERAQKYQELGLDFVIWNNRCQVSLSTIEYVFQHYSHCIGTAEGENFSGMYWERGPEGNLAELDFLHQAWTLCAKYGRLYFFADGDGGSYRWEEFAQREKELLQKYRRNIVLMFKTTNGDVSLHSYGMVEGLMASGWVENCGIWDDEWIWPCCGFGKLGEIIPPEKIWANRRKLGTKQCPWVYDLQIWLEGIAGGSTVFQLESAHQWGASGEPSKNYPRFFLPFVKAVVAHHIIPPRQAYLDGIKVAVQSDIALAKAAGSHHKQYTGAFAYLKELYALKADGEKDLIANDSRYGVICLLPPGGACLNPKTQVVPQAQLGDPAQARKLFNAAYPARFQGEAFMWECDGSVIAMNSSENEDCLQSFAMPFANGPMRSLNGRLSVHQYLMGKLASDGRSLWFQVNGEYPDREIEVALNCQTKPECVVTPTAAAKELRWDESSQQLKLRLSVAEGAVEVQVTAPAGSGGWKSYFGK